MLVQLWKIDLHANLQLETENSELTVFWEVKYLLEFMFNQEGDHKPKCIFLMLLEMNKCWASYKVHALRVPDLDFWGFTFKNC